MSTNAFLNLEQSFAIHREVNNTLNNSLSTLSPLPLKILSITWDVQKVFRLTIEGKNLPQYHEVEKESLELLLNNTLNYNPAVYKSFIEVTVEAVKNIQDNKKFLMVWPGKAVKLLMKINDTGLTRKNFRQALQDKGILELCPIYPGSSNKDKANIWMVLKNKKTETIDHEAFELIALDLVATFFEQGVNEMLIASFLQEFASSFQKTGSQPTVSIDQKVMQAIYDRKQDPKTGMQLLIENLESRYREVLEKCLKQLTNSK